MTGGSGTGVAAVVVSHQTRDEALGCLRTLAEAGADELVLVDTGSTDGTPDAVRRELPEVDVIVLGNVGYAQAVNVGVRKTAAPYVVVANADTRFASGALGAMARAMDAAPDIGAVGPLVRYPDGRRQASVRRFPHVGEAAGHALLGLFWPSNPWTRSYRMLDVDPDRARDVDWVSGCAMALRRRAFEDVAGFDPGYFMFVEDVDLCYRLGRAGWRVRYEPEARVLHRVGASTRRRRLAMVVAHARSLDRFYGRAYDTPIGRLLRPLVRLGLAVWALLVLAWGAIAGVRRGRSPTGE